MESNLEEFPVNQYGNVDITEEISSTFSFMEESHICLTAKKNGIPYKPAFQGFRQFRGQFFPIIKGIVVRRRDREILLQAYRTSQVAIESRKAKKELKIAQLDKEKDFRRGKWFKLIEIHNGRDWMISAAVFKLIKTYEKQDLKIGEIKSILKEAEMNKGTSRFNKKEIYDHFFLHIVRPNIESEIQKMHETLKSYAILKVWPNIINEVEYREVNREIITPNDCLINRKFRYFEVEYREVNREMITPIDCLINRINFNLSRTWYSEFRYFDAFAWKFTSSAESYYYSFQKPLDLFIEELPCKSKDFKTKIEESETYKKLVLIVNNIDTDFSKDIESLPKFNTLPQPVFFAIQKYCQAPGK
eukprot:Pgem_evm1s30